MSAQDLNLSKPVRYRKPRADVYTLLLGIALAALIVACIFAFLEISDYGDQPASGAPSVSAALPAERLNGVEIAAAPGRDFSPGRDERMTVLGG